MLNKFSKFSVALVAVFALFACATQAPSKEKVTESIKKIIPVKFEVVSVSLFKQVPGLVQVVVSMSNQPVVLYMDMKGKYVVSGSIVELDSKKNLTVETLNSFRGLLKGSSPASAMPAPKAK